MRLKRTDCVQIVLAIHPKSPFFPALRLWETLSGKSESEGWREIFSGTLYHSVGLGLSEKQIPLIGVTHGAFRQ